MPIPRKDAAFSATIIVPTHNRYSYLKRQLQFYAQLQFPLKIMVLDTSSEECNDPQLKELLNSQHVRYLRFPTDAFFAEKIANGAQQIDTEYCLICADDDFISPKGIAQCVRFLNKHLHYACAEGMFINISGEVKKSWMPMYTQAQSIENADPLMRFSRFLSADVPSVFYAVFPIAIFRSIWNETVKYTSDWNLMEIFPLWLTLISGRIKLLPVFYAARQAHTISWVGVEQLQKLLSEPKCQKVVEGMTENLKNICPGLSGEDLHRRAKEKMDGYCMQSFKKFDKGQSRPSPQDLCHRGVRFLLWRFRKLRSFLIFKATGFSEFREVLAHYQASSVSENEIHRTRNSYSGHPRSVLCEK